MQSFLRANLDGSLAQNAFAGCNAQGEKRGSKRQCVQMELKPNVSGDKG
jgi:hypothetical protein